MKRFKLGVLALLLILSDTILAQRNPTTILVQGGPLFSSFHGAGYTRINRDHLLGFQAGLFVQDNIRKNLFFTTGLRFQKLGSRIRNIQIADQFGNIIGLGDIHEELNYLSLPVIVAYRFGNRIRVNLEAGVFVGRLIDQATKVRAVDPYSMQQINYEITNPDFKDFNGGVLAGFDLEIPLQKRFRLKLGFRDELGLLSIYDVGEDGIKTNSLNILAGVAFAL